MISKIDSLNTYDLGKKFAIIDPASEKLKKNYSKYKKMKKYVSYNSHDNDYLTVKELKKL